MIPICLLAEAIAVEICSRFIVDKLAKLVESDKPKPVPVTAKRVRRRQIAAG